MPGVNSDPDFDPQDSAEVFDEDNYNTDQQVGEMRTFEETPDVLDVTSARGDRDDDEAVSLDADEFEAEAFDDELDLEEDNELDYRAAADNAEDDETALLGVAGVEGPDEIAAGADPSENPFQEDLDDSLEQTFPASDPVSITRRED
jgi:hypothetical protein